MKTRTRSPIDRGRKAAEKFVPRTVKAVTREQLVDYGAVLYARGYQNARKRRA